MQQVSIYRWTARIVTSGVLAMLVTLGMGHTGALVAQQNVQFASSSSGDAEVTFTAHVAPILQKNCQLCHQEGSLGPMPLMTYQDARRWSSRMVDMVVQREMPPYQYDTDTGIQDLKYDPRMSEEEIETIVAWVESGMVEGDPARLPGCPP